jgi:ribonuclease D
LKLVAEKEGVAPKVLASSDDLDRIAADGDNADVPAFHGWRRAVFGEQALKLVHGELALRFVNRNIVVFEAGGAA